MDINQLVISPRDPDESNSEYAYRNIRDNIIRINLKPGELLNEAEISNALNTGRTPIREALVTLRNEKLVDIIPRKESRVSFISISLVNEAVFSRKALEPTLIKRMAGNVSQDIMQEFKDNLDLQKDIVENGSFYDFYPIDDEFHKLLYKAAFKLNLYDSLSRMTAHYNRVRYLSRIMFGGNGDSNFEKLSYLEHVKMYNLLLMGISNEFDLDELFSRHILRFQLIDGLLDNNEYFRF